jgi:hypothetical protein
MKFFIHIIQVYLLPACLLIAAGACRRDIDYDLAYEGDRLVVNGLISPQQTAAVSVSRSNAPSGQAPPDLSVTGATVLLYENAVLLEQLVHGQRGQYASPSGFKPRAGNAYFVQVTAPGLPPAQTALARVPNALQLESYSYRTGLNSYLNPSEPAAEVEITLLDSAQTADYYQVEIAALYNGVARGVSTWLVGETEEAGQPCVRLNNSSVTYRDDCFNGTTYRSIIGVETRGIVLQNGQEPVEVDYQRLRVRVRRISADYYRYLETTDLNEGIGLAFFEPTFQHANVEGGFGIWAAANEQELVFNLIN